MENKLPVVGKRYQEFKNRLLMWAGFAPETKANTCREIYDVASTSFKKEQSPLLFEAINLIDDLMLINLDRIAFAKLPEDKPQIKLPVVGKRYVSKRSGNILTVKQIRISGNIITDDGDLWSPDYFATEFEELPEDKAEINPSLSNCKRCGIQLSTICVSGGFCSVDCANNARTETKPETQSSELSPEVKEAIMDLKLKLYSWDQLNKMDLIVAVGVETRRGHGDMIAESTQNLLNALDKQFKVNETTKSVDVKEEEVKEEESIWKPVSELPTYHCQVLVKFTNHRQIFIYDCDGNSIINTLTQEELDLEFVSGFMILTDFINDYEKLKERVKKLEGND